MIEYQHALKPSEHDPRDKNIEAVLYESVSLPGEYDISDSLLPVRDQGLQGSCSAMTAATLREYQEQAEWGLDNYISPQFIYNIRSNQGSEGMTPRDTMKILASIGVVKEKLFPYGNLLAPSKSLLNLARHMKIKDYAKVHTIEAAKKSILANGPLYIGLPVFNGNSIRFWEPSPAFKTLLGGHAVCLVGWTKEGFILRNSWGKSWGNNGYTILPFDHWGYVWEAWTTYDEKTCVSALKEEIKKLNTKPSKVGCFFSKWFNKS